MCLKIARKAAGGTYPAVPCSAKPLNMAAMAAQRDRQIQPGGEKRTGRHENGSASLKAKGMAKAVLPALYK